METINTFSQKVINGLRKTAIELEELQVQLALGKAEVSDKYEEVKKSFNKFLHEAKEVVKEGKVRATSVQQKIEELQLQLHLGKAETKEAFNEQRKKISKALKEVEAVVETKFRKTEFYHKATNEIHKFKIKLDILRLRFELKNIDAKDEFEKRKKEFSEKLTEIKQRFTKGETSLKTRTKNFDKEINAAYSHLKKAFTW